MLIVAAMMTVPKTKESVPESGAPYRFGGQVGVGHLIGHADRESQVGEIGVGGFVVVVEVTPPSGPV